MLVCKAVTFACAALSLRWQMADDSLEDLQDMGMYTVLCAISTFCGRIGRHSFAALRSQKSVYSFRML